MQNKMLGVKYISQYFRKERREQPPKAIMQQLISKYFADLEQKKNHDATEI